MCIRDRDDILPEAFAVVREASKRVLNMRHFDVQIIDVYKRQPIASSIVGGFPEWPKGADCKSVTFRFGGSNPPSSTI